MAGVLVNNFHDILLKLSESEIVLDWLLAVGVRLTLKLGEFNTRLWLPAGLAVFSDYIGEDAATYVEFGCDAHKLWLGSCYKVIQNAVSHSLVEATFIAERPHIEF